jgi:ADP-heptose:LPS heptosyltransferase
VVAWLRSRGLHPVLTGSASERGVAADVAARSGVPTKDVVAGETDVVQLAGIVAGARLVLAGDTGVGHLATALARPSVLLFGPTSPEHWGPPADRPEHIVLWAGVRGDPHAQVPSRGLLAIGVDDVRDAAQRQLDAVPDVSLRSLAG